jgi:hypothetical protein
MSLDLPAPVPTYFAAKNTHDIDAMLAQFASDAHVQDEGKDYRGSDAIRGWIARTTAKYAVTVEPEIVSTEAELTIVRALVSGNFPGSPAHLTYRFTLADARIAKLSIG